jgi:hypothetical protein
MSLNEKYDWSRGMQEKARILYDLSRLIRIISPEQISIEKEEVVKLRVTLDRNLELLDARRRAWSIVTKTVRRAITDSCSDGLYRARDHHKSIAEQC